MKKQDWKTEARTNIGFIVPMALLIFTTACTVAQAGELDPANQQGAMSQAIEQALHPERNAGDMGTNHTAGFAQRVYLWLSFNDLEYGK